MSPLTPLWWVLGRFDPFAVDVGVMSERHFRRHPVWEFDVNSEWLPWRDETWMRPVRRLPVRSLGGRIVGTTLTLANGRRMFGTLSGVSLNHPRATRCFIGASLYVGGRDVQFIGVPSPAYPYVNAAGLARALSLRVEDAFPLSYDLTGLAVGHPDVIRGTIPAERPEQLSDEDELALFFEADETEVSE